jgi:hypothetical protein
MGEQNHTHCVVLDANIWISHMLLNSAVGVAFLYRLRSMNARIGLPEVVELEVMLRTIDEGMDARDGIEKNLGKVRSLLGETEEIELPSEQTFRKAVEDRFSYFGDFIERICISPAHYRQALMNVINRVPPNQTKEQYRDSLIWEAINDLSKAYNVTFVTNDRDFYASKDPGSGLAPALKKQTTGRAIQLFSNLEEFLASFSEKVPPPDYATIAAMINAELTKKGSVLSWGANKGFTVDRLIAHSIEAFVTEKVAVLALSFKLTYRILNVLETQTIIEGRLSELDDPIEHAEATLVCSGNCYFDEKTATVSELQPHDIDCFALDGRELVGFGGGYMYAFIGRRNIPHRVRRRIDQI